jgi:hypothetical protein
VLGPYGAKLCPGDRLKLQSKRKTLSTRRLPLEAKEFKKSDPYRIFSVMTSS